VAPSPSQSPSRWRFSLLPCKRLLAIDPGRHCLKLLLVEERLGRIRIRHQELVEVQAGGALSEEETLRQAQDLIHELGEDPVALALPHDRAISQLVDLPPVDASEARRLIEEETVKLSGLGESNIVFDYTTLRPFGRHGNPFWVTLCREEEVQRQVDRCGLGEMDLCEVTTSANALIAAGLAARLEGMGENVALVDFGATGTTVVMFHGGQAVEATQFPIGGDSLTEAVAARNGCGLDAAETLKRGIDLRGDPAETAVLTRGLREWHAELRRVLGQWLQDRGGPATPGTESIRVVLTGGASLQPGLLEFLNGLGSLQIELWPSGPAGQEAGGRFAVAYGSAIQALGRSGQPVSLLPAPMRRFWRGHHSVNLLHSLVLLLLALLVVALGFGTWQKRELIEHKQALMERSRTALDKARTIEELSMLARQRYERLRPGLERQQGTLDILRALALLQQVRGDKSYWFVLFSDVPSYLTAPPWGDTNPAPATLPVGPALFPVREGFVVEVCVPQRGEAMRTTLSQLVSDLREARLFANVDLLPADRRRPVVDTTVVLPDQHFTLALELPAGRIPPLPPLAEGRSTTNAVGSSRRAASEEIRPSDRPVQANSARLP
jgi:Tfp pilus assembly PilM family ATPase